MNFKIAYRIICVQLVLIAVLMLVDFSLRNWYASGQLTELANSYQSNILKGIQKAQEEAQNLTQKIGTKQNVVFEELRRKIIKEICDLQELHANDVVTEAITAVEGSLARGELVPFKNFAAAQTNVRGIMEFSYFSTAEGRKIQFSSVEKPQNEFLPSRVWENLNKDKQAYQKVPYRESTEDYYEYYVPLIVKKDLKRLNPEWKLGDRKSVV